MVVNDLENDICGIQLEIKLVINPFIKSSKIESCSICLEYYFESLSLLLVLKLISIANFTNNVADVYLHFITTTNLITC